jgi:CheY-like chemotaxis protein
LSKGRHVLLTVSDTGSGIDPDKLEHIFDPFFTTKPVGQGTGMGLAVVHSIIKNMKGIITVESAPGAGATFRIIIPAEDAAITDKARNNSMICAGNEHVIFVDDEEAILKTARIMLSNQGYRVTVFSDARSALERFRSDSRAFDIMVTDYSMPEMTGMELIREIRAIRKDFPVILSSGYMNESMEAEARKAGVDELLPKPVTIHELCRVIRMCLDRRAS